MKHNHKKLKANVTAIERKKDRAFCDAPFLKERVSYLVLGTRAGAGDYLVLVHDHHPIKHSLLYHSNCLCSQLDTLKATAMIAVMAWGKSACIYTLIFPSH